MIVDVLHRYIYTYFLLDLDSISMSGICSQVLKQNTLVKHELEFCSKIA